MSKWAIKDEWAFQVLRHRDTEEFMVGAMGVDERDQEFARGLARLIEAWFAQR